MRFSEHELHISGRIVIVALSVNVVSAVLIIVVVVGVVVVSVVVDRVVKATLDVQQECVCRVAVDNAVAAGDPSVGGQPREGMA